MCSSVARSVLPATAREAYCQQNTQKQECGRMHAFLAFPFPPTNKQNRTKEQTTRIGHGRGRQGQQRAAVCGQELPGIGVKVTIAKVPEAISARLPTNIANQRPFSIPSHINQPHPVGFNILLLRKPNGRSPSHLTSTSPTQSASTFCCSENQTAVLHPISHQPAPPSRPQHFAAQKT